MSELRGGVKLTALALAVAVVVSSYPTAYLVRHQTTTFISATDIAFATKCEDHFFAPAKFIHRRVAANHFFSPAEFHSTIGTILPRLHVPTDLEAIPDVNEDEDQP